MILRTTAIPLASFPYSSTSRIVHWLTRHHGKISTLLNGVQRNKSPFLGEYELFSTSELLYFAKRTETLYTGKECALLHRRKTFRTDWRAMQAASYISTLFNKTTPENAPQPELFEFYEELLDLAEEYGHHPQFILWAELTFCDHHGHAPNLESCVLCSAENDLRFCASQGGVVCFTCEKEKKLPTIASPVDTLTILRTLQKTEHPASLTETQLTGAQRTALANIVSAFMLYHFNIHPRHRTAAAFVA